MNILSKVDLSTTTNIIKINVSPWLCTVIFEVPQKSSPANRETSGCIAEASMSITWLNVEQSMVGVEVLPPAELAIDWFSGVDGLFISF